MKSLYAFAVPAQVILSSSTPSSSEKRTISLPIRGLGQPQRQSSSQWMVTRSPDANPLAPILLRQLREPPLEVFVPMGVRLEVGVEQLAEPRRDLELVAGLASGPHTPHQRQQIGRGGVVVEAVPVLVAAGGHARE